MTANRPPQETANDIAQVTTIVAGCPTCHTTGGIWSCPIHSPQARIVSVNPHVSPLLTEEDIRRIVREELRNSLKVSHDDAGGGKCTCGVDGCDE